MSTYEITIVIRLFIRLFVGLVLISAGISKGRHFTNFYSGIQEYQLFPRYLDRKLAYIKKAALVIPIIELCAGLGLMSGIAITYAIIGAIALFIIFCSVIIVSLLHGQHKLMCNCGGLLGSHAVSWRLVPRNVIFIVCLSILLVTPSDIFTIPSLSSVSPERLWNIALPTIVLVGTILIIIVLLNSLQSLRRI